MARSDRRRTKRSRPAPGIRAAGGATAVEHTLFFSRLRRQAKWMFVFLALVFGIGFVAFGVGSDVQGGLADLIQGRAPGSGPSVAEAREKVEQDPLDATALRELSTALQQDGRPEEAIPYLQRYAQIETQDVDALRELATLYLSRAGRLRGEVQAAQARAAALTPGEAFLPPGTTDLGQALAERPISNAVTSSVQGDISERFARMESAYGAAQRVYGRVAALQPQDAGLQLQLADAAANAGDVAGAIAAYERFLELAPDDPQAPLVEQEIERLRPFVGVQSGLGE